MNRKFKLIFFLSVFLVSILLLFPFWKSDKTPTQNQKSPIDEELTSTETNPSDVFEYSGVEGVDALTLLEQNTEVEKDGSGFVTSINGRVADSGKREFWGFYVNGGMANVGPASYETKGDDKILWRIETY